MNVRGIHSILGAALSLCLALDPLQAAMNMPATDAANGATSTSSDETPATSPTLGGGTDLIATTKPPASVMGGIDFPKNPVTMDFQDADIRDVLHLLAVKSGLNIIYGADVTGPISVHLDRVPFDQAFQTVLTLKGLVALAMGSRLIRVVTSTGLTTEQSQAATFTRVFRLNYALAEDIKKPVDAIRAAAQRKGVSTVDTKTNSLIVTDTTEGLKEVEDLIPILDKKPQQVDIEAKIVEVTLSNDTQTGITWQYAGSTGPHDAYKFGATQQVTGNNAAGTSATQGGKVISPLGPANGGTGVSLNNIITGSTPVGLSFLTAQGTYLLSAEISALATENRVKVLSTPHVVTTNNEEAHIDVVNQIPYQVTTISNGLSQSSIQFEQAGVKLAVKPTVNADRRITMKVKPEVSNAGAANSNPLIPPSVNTRTAETTVVLRDGETIAIGGLIQENLQKTVTGVPILMSIPIIGYLFKTTDNNKQRTELIVFLTPKIAAE